MTSNPHTPGHAAMLTAVAKHVTDHPDLCPVNILSDDRLQLRCSEHPARDLVAWAATLADVGRVDVHGIYCEHTDDVQAFVYVSGVVGDIAVSVWTTVPGVIDAVGPDAFDAGHMSITLAGLRAFAVDGTVPVPGSLAPA